MCSYSQYVKSQNGSFASFYVLAVHSSYSKLSIIGTCIIIQDDNIMVERVIMLSYYYDNV